MALSTVWTKHIQDPEKKEAFTKAIKASNLGFGRLLELLHEDLKEIERSEQTIADFADPNWAYKQAFRNGEKARLNKIIKLLTFT